MCLTCLSKQQTHIVRSASLWTAQTSCYVLKCPHRYQCLNTAPWLVILSWEVLELLGWEVWHMEARQWAGLWGIEPCPTSGPASTLNSLLLPEQFLSKHFASWSAKMWTNSPASSHHHWRGHADPWGCISWDTWTQLTLVEIFFVSYLITMMREAANSINGFSMVLLSFLFLRPKI